MKAYRKGGKFSESKIPKESRTEDGLRLGLNRTKLFYSWYHNANKLGDHAAPSVSPEQQEWITPDFVKIKQKTFEAA